MKKSAKILLFSIVAVMFIAVFITFRPAQIGGGNYYFIVSSGSMEPTLNVGDWIVCSKADFNDVKVGDIITVKHPSENFLIVHRVVNKNEAYLITKGDVCDAPDNFVVQPKNVLARYSGLRIPKFGFILYFFTRTFLGLIIMYWVPCFIIVAIVVRKFRGKKENAKTV